jgi:putative transposase
MPRPLRIQYSGACYHVINRGAGRRRVFKSDEQSAYFLSLLEAVSERFAAEIHGYCLLNNGYQLMVRTPEGNLERIMRHVNGLYTQHWNRTARQSGALFRGRYKAVLVDPEPHWPAVSRFLHLAPVSAGLAGAPEGHAWSSYRAYVGAEPAPAWLHTEMVLGAFGARLQGRRYQAYVAEGVDDETARFYARTHLPSVLGDPQFRRRAVANPVALGRRTGARAPRRPTFGQINRAVAAHYGVRAASLLKSARGRGVATPARSLAMYVAQEHGGETLARIAEHFGLAGYASAGATIRNLRNRLQEDASLRADLAAILRKLDIAV